MQVVILLSEDPIDDNDWRITPNVDPELHRPDQNDLKWQQQKGQEL